MGEGRGVGHDPGDEEVDAGGVVLVGVGALDPGALVTAGAVAARAALRKAESEPVVNEDALAGV